MTTLTRVNLGSLVKRRDSNPVSSQESPSKPGPVLSQSLTRYAEGASRASAVSSVFLTTGLSCLG